MPFTEARKRAGLTQGEVAEILGVSAATVSMWENGRMKPRASLLPKIAGLYHCTIDSLMASEDAKSKP